jgi:hypothetical protein
MSATATKAAEQAAPAAAPAVAAAPAAEPEEELLEVVDDSCQVTCLARRGDVHRLGLKHRAVYVWVFDGDGRLLLQRRSFDKKIGPGQWDLSAAEHLSPGRCFLFCVIFRVCGLFLAPSFFKRQRKTYPYSILFKQH